MEMSPKPENDKSSYQYRVAHHALTKTAALCSPHQWLLGT